MENVKKKYETFRKKYSLPKFSDLIKEFNVNSENPDLILHDIVDKINDRVMSHAKIIESIIFVGAGETASNLFEAKMLRNRRKSIFDLGTNFEGQFYHSKTRANMAEFTKA